MATATARPILGLSRLLQSTSVSSTGSIAAASLTTAPRRAHPSLLSQSSPASFSTTAPLHKRRRFKTRDNNRLRGVSTRRGTGPREFLSVSNDPLPRPRIKTKEEKEKEKSAGPFDPEHPLWEFFYKPGQLIPEPVDDAKHGRAWTVEELRRKGWEDLHRLWYKCLKEMNRIATAEQARNKNNLGFGGYEAEVRQDEVKKTMSAIKHVLTERYYAWEDAVELAKEDPEIDLSGDGPAYTPREYLEEELLEEPEDYSSETAAETPEQKAIDTTAIPGEAAPSKGAEQSAPKP